MTIKEDKVKKKKDFSKKWYTEKFLNELKNTAYQEKDKNLVYTVKCSPDAVSKYGLDPRMLGGPIGKMAKGLQFVPDFIFKHMNMKLNENNIISFRESCSKISYERLEMVILGIDPGKNLSKKKRNFGKKQNTHPYFQVLEILL